MKAKVETRGRKPARDPLIQSPYRMHQSVVEIMRANGREWAEDAIRHAQANTAKKAKPQEVE